MNQPEDWDVIWRWQWFRRPLWQDHFREPSHAEGRVARSTPFWVWLLQHFGATRVLDCSCGLGLRAIMLQEAGFQVTGTDVSRVAVEHARELAADSRLTIPFRQLRWNELGEEYDQEFDSIVNDAFAWTLSRSDLRFAAHNFAAALKPGGALLFTGADQWSSSLDRTAQIESAWQSAPRFQLRDDYGRDGTHLDLLVVRDKTEHGIVENYVFLVRDGEAPRIETAAICSSVDWAWEDYQAVCHEAGFRSLESLKVAAGGREHNFNVALK